MACEVTEQFPTATTDVEDLLDILPVGEGGDGLGQNGSQGAVRGRREMSGRPALLPIEAGGTIERVVPGVLPREGPVLRRGGITGAGTCGRGLGR